MSAPQPPARLAYGVIVASYRRGVGIAVNCFEYAREADARRWFDSCVNDPTLIALGVTLEGPDGEVLAEYDPTTPAPHPAHSED